MISEEQQRRLADCPIQAGPWRWMGLRGRTSAWPSAMTAKTIPKTAENNRQSISGQRRLQCPDGGQGRGNGNVLPSDSRGHLHISFTFIRLYALRMQPYAVVMHFLSEIEKPMKSRAESACKKPYALYAPLLGVRAFSGLFL